MGHIPAMLPESLEFFREKKIRTFFDGTLGAGGFARVLLSEHPEIETYFGCDRDERALKLAKDNLEAMQDRVKFIHGNFRDLDELLAGQGIQEVDGFFFDFGVSSMQLDQEDRGFSFMKEGPLDMRMDRNENLSAKDVVNTYSEKELGEIFREYGEEKNWRGAARAVIEARRKKPIETTKELADIIAATGRKSRKKLHPATLVFQALRIFVNRELEAIQEGVGKAIKMLASGGLIGTISFHRLEDRIVKNVFRDASKPMKKIIGMKETTFLPMMKLVTKSPFTPSREEQRENPRARSAKLRFAEKL